MSGNRQIFDVATHTADRHRWDSQWPEAMHEYQRALAEFPDDTTAHSGLGYCYMQTKQWQKALDEYEYIFQRDPSNVIVLSKIAELYGILNRREDAYTAYLHLADLYSEASQEARAEAAWLKAAQLSSGNPEPHERLASYYFEQKDITAMIQQRLAAAQGYLARNDFVAASTQCEEVLRADGANVQAQQLLARIRNGSASLPSEPTMSMATAADPGDDTFLPADRPPQLGASLTSFTSQEDNSGADTIRSSNTDGGTTGIMGNMGNFGGVSNPGPAPAMNGAGGGMESAPRKRITANQVTGVLKQAQAYQSQGRFNDAIDLCEQILESGFDRPDARYFLGWLYQEQQRWNDAIRQFQMLLNDQDYALSCYYALGQCYRARGDLRTAAVHFDEAVDRVNLDALTVEESDQLVQLCQEAAEAHRLLGEQEQTLTVYNALLGFLRSRGWNDKVAQVEFMLQQTQGAPASSRPPTPPTAQVQAQPVQPAMQPPAPPVSIPDAATMAFNVASLNGAAGPQVNVGSQSSMPPSLSSATGAVGELPDWLTGILSDSEKTQIQERKTAPAPSAPQASAPPLSEQDIAMAQTAFFTPVVPPTEQARPQVAAPAPTVQSPVSPVPPAQSAQQAPAAPPSWLTDDMKAPANGTRSLPVEQLPVVPTPPAAPPVVPAQQAAPAQAVVPPPPPMPVQTAVPAPPAPVAPPPVVPPAPAVQPAATAPALFDLATPVVPTAQAAPEKKAGIEEMLGQMAGSKDDGLKQVADAVLTSTATLPENVRRQVVRSMQDIQNYVSHGLLTSATEESLRVIDIAPQYLDIHQVLCEIYVRQGKIEQAITKYAILVDTYIVNGRTEDAVATYRRILQLEPNNLTYRLRLVSLLSTLGNKEDLLRERTLAAESYLRLGYMDRALNELEQALQESPTSVPTRLNYALALQKLGRTQQAVAEYQRVLQVDPRNIAALVRWHIAMITTIGAARAAALEVLARIRWQLRGEGQKNADAVLREYMQTVDIYPNNADLHYSLGQIYHQCGQFDQAVDSYILALRDSAVEILGRVGIAQCLLVQGKPEPAMQQLEQALQAVRHSSSSVDPATWAARPREEGETHQAPEVEISLLLANTYGRVGRQEEMQALIRQVKQGKPSQDEVSSTLAEISTRQGGDTASIVQESLELARHYRSNRQTDNAINVLNEILRMAPQDPRPHHELADINIQRGLLDEGIAELRLLADIYLRRNQLTDAGVTIQRIGNLYDEMGNNEEALANLCRAVDLIPDSMELLREVVGFCWRLGRQHEAGKYQVIIARYYFETQQVKEAVAALQQLIAIDKNNYDAYDMLGRAYQSVGEYEQASRVYRNLAKINPGNTKARERLATLQELRTK